MLRLLKEFQKDAVKLKRSATVDEFKLWLEAHMPKKAVDVEMGSYIDEAIDFILNPSSELHLLQDLVEAVAEDNKEEAKHLLKSIEEEHSQIFDGGLYHLPGKPLQDLVEEYLGEVEMWVEEGEEVSLEEETPTE